ncbi:IS116 IS110 IS902 family protein, putative [Babesia caballi]|uniref:IS116 IS110 IS902 family protein, putative n=1 Tax=Babesia caballi TaxID=5871 RepID=A0AAV4LT06_BABCB|nr:IS116 IS110 IS902 family protein, putative [Babesia caballi]
MNIAKYVCGSLPRQAPVLARSCAVFCHPRPSTDSFSSRPPLRHLPPAWFASQHRTLTASIETDPGSKDTASDSNDATGLNADSGAPPDEPFKSMDGATFVRILSTVNDRNTGLVLALQKFKSELQAEGSRTYPFRLRDLRVLLDFSSQLLALQRDERDKDVISGVFELFKSDANASAAFHLCRLFSSYNNCQGRTLTSSVFQRLVHNRIGMMGARFLSPQKMEKLGEKYGPGAECALEFIASSLTHKDMGSLQRCCDSTLFDFLSEGMAYLERMGLKLKFEISSVKSTKLDKFLLTIGGKRDDKVASPYVMKQAVAHQIVVTLPKAPPSSSDDSITLNRQQHRDLVLQTFEKGVIARMEVLLTVRQSLSLVDSEGAVVWEDLRKLGTHKLTFESEIEVKSRDGEDFDTKDWTVVDINGVLNSNAPFTA